MTRRVYVPATLGLLAEWHVSGTVPAGAARVTAATDDEDSEYDALMAAAEQSSRLPDGGGRRVVVVAEGAATGPVAMHDVVAVHCDTQPRPPGADPDDQLAWFATQEIPDLL